MPLMSSIMISDHVFQLTAKETQEEKRGTGRGAHVRGVRGHFSPLLACPFREEEELALMMLPEIKGLAVGRVGS